jgi:hypothetical protein
LPRAGPPPNLLNLPPLSSPDMGYSLT